MKATFLVLFAALLIGCDADTPAYPKADTEQEMFGKQSKQNYVIFSPMKGTLMQGGKPLANAKIIRCLRWNGNDEGLVDEFVTDEQGRFSLPIHEEQLSLGMLSQFVAKADIAIEDEQGIEYIWTSSKFYPEVFTETNGEVSELICDVDFEEIAVPMGPSSILTKCRWKNMPN